MKKQIKEGRNYIVCNIDEPYAADVFNALKGGALKDNWDKNNDLKTTFKEFCKNTFGGLWMPFLTIGGERSYWLKTDGNNNVVNPREQLINILYEEYCGADKETLHDEIGITETYLKDHMWKKMANVLNCQDRVLTYFNTNYLQVLLIWEWVEVEDLEKEWDGF